MPIPLGILAVAGAGAAGGGGAYDLLETTILSSTTATVSFSSLGSYSSYKHLQIRFAARSDRASAADVLYLQFNSDTGSNYAWHRLQGTGSTVESGAGTSADKITTSAFAAASSSANIFGSGVLDILDFGNSSKNTTIRNLGGYHGGSTLISLYSGFWNNTAAVTSITLSCISSFVSGSRFSLYGIR